MNTNIYTKLTNFIRNRTLELIGIVIGYTAGVLIGIGYQIYMAILKLKIEFSSFLNV